MKNPKVTVLMPAYNTEKFLKEAINSILNQSFKDFELLIINDGSTDQTAKILQEYKDPRIKIIDNQKNMGEIKSRNFGIKIAKGRYIALMDSDDISLPKRLEKQVNYLDTHPYYDVVVAKIQVIDICGNLIEKWKNDQDYITYKQIRKQLPIDNCIANPTVMMRSSLIKKYRYNESLSLSEDYELWLRLCADGKKIEKINEELVYYRMRPNSLTGYFKQKPDYKKIKIKYYFLKGRINQFKIGYFEIKTTLYLLNDIFFFVYTYFRKNIICYLKRGLIIIGKIIGNITPSKYSSEIFYFFPHYHIGGAEKVHADIVNCVKTEKQQLIIFTNKSCSSNFKYLFEGKGHILDISSFPFNSISRYIIAGILIAHINKLSNAVTFGSNNTLYYEILRYLKPNVFKIDLIHAFGIGMEYVSLPLVDYLDYRIVTNQKIKMDLYDLYESYGFGKKLNKRVLVIELEVELPKLLKPKRHGSIYNFIYVGRWAEEKRVYLILEAAKLCFEKKIPADFTIIGDIPTSVKNQYCKYCKFTGEIKSFDVMKEYYKKADFILITSTREGSCLAIMEAMAYGVIPISTNVGNIPLYIKNWINGILIEDKAESEIAVKILETINKVNKNHPLVKKMSLNAYQYAVKHFFLGSFCQKYNQLIQKCLDQKQPKNENT